MVLTGCHDLNVTVQLRPDELHWTPINLKPSVFAVLTVFAFTATLWALNFRRLLRRYDFPASPNA